MASVPTISELVRGRLDQVGVSSYTLEDLSGAAGARVSRQQFDLLKDGDISTWPTQPEKIKGYAAALGVDERTVVLAFARQLGLDVEENQSALASMLPRTTERLTTAQSIAVADLVRVFTAQESGLGERLDLHGCSPEELRLILDLWTELTERAETALPGVAKALRLLAHVLDVAIQEAKR